MSDDHLTWAVTDGVARLTINRPDAAGAITPDMRNRMIDLLGEASADLAVRVVVIGSVGKHFAPGPTCGPPSRPDRHGPTAPPNGPLATSPAPSAPEPSA